MRLVRNIPGRWGAPIALAAIAAALLISPALGGPRFITGKKVNKTIDSLSKQLGRTPSVKEVAEKLGVGLEEVLDATRDHLFLIVGGDDDGDGGEDLLAAHGARGEPRSQSGRSRIPRMGPRERGEAAPEELPHQTASSRKSSR